MRVWLLVSSLLLVFPPGRSLAQLDVPCASVVPFDTTVYTFTRTVVLSLEHAQRALDAIPTEAQSSDAGAGMIYVLRKQRGHYLCAVALLSPFARHANEDVQLAVEAGQLMYASMASVADALLNIYRSLIAGEAGLSAAQMADSLASLRLRSEAVTSELPVVMAGSVIAALSEMDRITGRLSRLALTVPQRDTLLADLVRVFGPAVAAGPSAQQPWTMAAGLALYSSLSDPAWRLRPR